MEDGVKASTFARIPPPEQEGSSAPDRTVRNLVRFKHYSLRTEPAALDCGTFAPKAKPCYPEPMEPCCR
jgi:hypothetical protein